MEHECNTNVKILTFVFILIRSGKHPYSSQVVRIDSFIVRIVFGSSWKEHECILLFKTFVLVRVHIRIRTEFVAHSACSYNVLVVIRDVRETFVLNSRANTPRTQHKPDTDYHESLRTTTNAARTNTNILEFDTNKPDNMTNSQECNTNTFTNEQE